MKLTPEEIKELKRIELEHKLSQVFDLGLAIALASVIVLIVMTTIMAIL